MKDIFAELSWRGLIHQTTEPVHLARWLNEKSRTVYAGFDPTADSLHVGHLMGLVVLRRFQRAGHRPIALVGGATGMIGDPSGKSEERNLLSVDVLRANVAAIEGQMRRLLDFDAGPSAAILANNFDWMSRFSYLDFLRDIGKNFPVNVMLAKDSVRSRLENSEAGLSYTEFSYMLLQAYDFVHLFERHQCELQVGGSDQWGNITAGIDLGRRMKGAQLFGATWPLLTKADGSKMGKTESGAVWLSPERTPDNAFYQYWINIDDADVGKCLRFLTDLDRSEIEALEEDHRRNPDSRVAQNRLADEITTLVRGKPASDKAKGANKELFHVKASVRLELSGEAIARVFDSLGRLALKRSRLKEGLNVVDAFFEANLVKSKSDARRLIESGGAYVNNLRVSTISQNLSEDDLMEAEPVIILRSGKKKNALIIFRD